MVKNLILFLCYISILDCNKTKKEIYGLYETTSNFSLLKRNYINDVTLKIAVDGTYILTTCAQIEKGKWKINEQSLYLSRNERKFIIDSLNHIPAYQKGTICNIEPAIYKIKYASLVSEVNLQGKQYYIELHKVNNRREPKHSLTSQLKEEIFMPLLGVSRIKDENSSLNAE